MQYLNLIKLKPHYIYQWLLCGYLGKSRGCGSHGKQYGYNDNHGNGTVIMITMSQGLYFSTTVCSLSVSMVSPCTPGSFYVRHLIFGDVLRFLNFSILKAWNP